MASSQMIHKLPPMHLGEMDEGKTTRMREAGQSGARTEYSQGVVLRAASVLS